MNRDVAEGQWNQFKGMIKKQWGKFTDDDLKQIEGNSEAAIGRLQERYGHSKEEAAQAWQAFKARCDREQC